MFVVLGATGRTGEAVASTLLAQGRAVRVIVQAGSQWADGSGRLTRNQGGGVWKGQGMNSACAGTWQAERRQD